MVRLLAAGEALPGAPVLDWRNHTRRAKKRAQAIRDTRGKDKRQALYRTLWPCPAASRRRWRYASKDNLAAAIAAGVEDVAFHKKCGLTIKEMARSQWVYRKLRHFRAGIEAGISCLKRAYRLARCTGKGLGHFKAYVWSSVVAHNLALLARLKPL